MSYDIGIIAFMSLVLVLLLLCLWYWYYCFCIFDIGIVALVSLVLVLLLLCLWYLYYCFYVFGIGIIAFVFLILAILIWCFMILVISDLLLGGVIGFTTSMSQSKINEERESEYDNTHEDAETLTKVELPNTKISISQDMPLDIENDMMSETIVYYKNALIATIDELKCTIEFLKNELEEKNLHIRSLLLWDANDGRKVFIRKI